MREVIFVLGFLGCIGLYFWGRQILNKNLRKRAMINGKKYYKATGMKFRAVDNDEICLFDRQGLYHNGHNVCYGSVSNRIIEDYSLKEAEECNKELERCGKSFCFREYPTLNYCNKASVWYPVEKKTGRPFEIEISERNDSATGDGNYNIKREILLQYLNDENIDKSTESLKPGYNLEKEDSVSDRWIKALSIEEVTSYTMIGREEELTEIINNSAYDREYFKKTIFPHKKLFGR